MDDSEGKSPSDSVPKWQLNLPGDEPATDDAPQSQADDNNTQSDKLEVARRFLEDDAVKSAPREVKIDFLKSKGVGDEDIQFLLSEPEEEPLATEDSAPTDVKKSFAPTPPPPAAPAPPTSILAGSDRPPVVTYPEFLTKPQNDPPLVTTNGLLNTLWAFGGLSTLLYGASKFAVEPMVEKQTSARIDLHETTSKKLDSILAQLESTVSVVPSYNKSGANATSSETEDVDDPSEMFHRDIGTQTTSPLAASSKGKDEAQSKLQADRLSKLAKSLTGLTNDYKKQSTDSENAKAFLDTFRDELDTMTYGNQTEIFGAYDINKKKKKNDSEDEIRKVRDNIRRIKGVLLSARTFPTSAR
ncbi:peroxisomal membrane anchor domain-containing protein, variant 2 [Trichoderma atroviride IMI 206040]|uniref:Peroxisomal membrane protein PEX14 n=1 Tax=Hypocrea atroviridis (strain ATCC 20476 / IMI 206040) TaxID=452589 RepID=G9NU34_HYPAI|nr:peroxisomal membrane anchor domain-containing protein, variant 2 [Trichoderma atroviride IMI 206040]EHK45570.1 peroxisomal membrane anchor domain-containing protein, variant 2 [Trichoderma atroviride IMI 206040]